MLSRLCFLLYVALLFYLSRFSWLWHIDRALFPRARNEFLSKVVIAGQQRERIVCLIFARDTLATFYFISCLFLSPCSLRAFTVLLARAICLG